MTTKRFIWTNPDGTVSVLVPAPGVPEKVWRKDIPANVDAVDVDVADLPRDRLFRAAWKREGRGCYECPVKSKEVAHAIRRAKRAEEFAPHDEVIAKRLPGMEAQAEAARQRIRERYDVLQQGLDACQTPDELRSVLSRM